MKYDPYEPNVQLRFERNTEVHPAVEGPYPRHGWFHAWAPLIMQCIGVGVAFGLAALSLKWLGVW